MPTIERLDLLDPIVAAGGVRSRIQAWTEWGWIEAAARGGRASALNLRREVLDPMVREAAAATAGRRPPPRADRARPAARRRRPSPASSLRDRDGEETTLRGEARDRRRRARLAGRRAGRGQGKGHAPRALRLRRLLRGGAARLRARQRDLVPGPALGGRLPHRQRPRLLRGDADQGTAARVQTRPDRGADLVHGRTCRKRRRSATARLVEPVLGKIEMPNRDARARSRPAWRWSATRRWPPTRCSASAAAGRSSRANGSPTRSRPALRGEESLERGLKRYRRLHKRKLGGHAFMIHDYSTRPEAHAARTDAVRGGRPRPEDRRDASTSSRPARSGRRRRWRRRSRARSWSTPGTRCAGAARRAGRA